jgi:Tol biopolymer transport system component/DNA-binding winged helix-turn-helix (wHTH) protein
MTKPDNSQPDLKAEHKADSAIVCRIGDWLLDSGASRISHINGEQKRLTPKTLKVLLLLVKQKGVTVSRTELLDKVWKSTYPSDYVVSRAIADLRAAFGEEAKSASYIETVPKSGYRLVAKVLPIERPARSEHTQRPGGLYQRQNLTLKIGLSSLLSVFIVGALFVLLTQNSQTDDINIPLSMPVTSGPGLEQQSRVSSNAKWVVFASLGREDKDWNIYSQSLEGGTPRPVAVSEFVEYGPALSPSDEEVAYTRFKEERCEVVVQSLYQSKPQILSDCTTKFATVVDWSSREGQIAFTAKAENANGLRPIHLVNRHTKAITPLTQNVSQDGTDYYPRFSPDGSQLAFLRGMPKPDHHAHIFVIDLKTKQQRQLTLANSFHVGLTWLDENRILYTVRESGRLVSRTIDLSTGEKRELPLRDVFQPDYNAKYNVLSMSKLRKDVDITLFELTENKAQFIAESTASEWHGNLSPNGRWLAFVSTRTGNNQLWIASVSDGSTRQLTQFVGADISAPHWNVDSERLVFNVKQGEQRQLFTANIITGDTQVLNTGEGASTSARWLSNGKDIIYSCQKSLSWKLCQHNVQTGQSRTILNQKAFDPVVGENDARIYFTGDKTGLWSLDSNTANVRLEWENLPETLGAGWTIFNNTVYYLRSSSQLDVAQIESRSLTTGETDILYRGAIPSFNTSLEISNDGKFLVFQSWRSAQDDVVLYKSISL